MINYFPNPIAGKFCATNQRKFTLDSDFVYQDNEKDIRVTVPAGFTTDFSSVPGAFWAYFAPWEHPEAGLIHDWLYKAPERFQSATLKPPLDRGQCDDIFRRILHLKGVRWGKRQALWLALKIGGGRAWDKHRAADSISAQPGATGYTYLDALKSNQMAADGKAAPETKEVSDNPHVSSGIEEKGEL